MKAPHTSTIRRNRIHRLAYEIMYTYGDHESEYGIGYHSLSSKYWLTRKDRIKIAKRLKRMGYGVPHVKTPVSVDCITL